ncbi:hypothetical protein OG539_32900 [Actinacidiphila glaucinigra]|uniref:hypothetical protein n=1 Tax=Actinacidiphila glaucinigra TaxID=235986 RepID=UPI00324F39F2
MPLPAGVETVTVTSGEPLVLPDGTWMQGKLLFTGPDLVTIGQDDVVLGGTIEVPLVDGEFSVTLCATDATGMSPTGWTYTVRAVLANAPNWTRYITLPKASASVKLADILVPDPVAGEFTVLVDPSTIGGSTPASTVVSETSYGQSAAVGVATPYARADHTHGTPAASTPASIGALATVGDQTFTGELAFVDRIPVVPAFDPAFDNQLSRKAYVDGRVNTRLPLAGGAMTGPLRSTSAVFGQVHPARHGLKAWTWPPTEGSTAATATSGTLFLAEFTPAESFTTSFLHWHVSVTGVTATAGQNWVGIYAADGTLLASAGVDADVTSAAGARKTALAAALTAGQSYWAAFLFNAATAPQLARGGTATAGSSLTNINLTASTLRFASNGTSRTALPSPLVPASNVAGSAYFAAVE